MTKDWKVTFEIDGPEGKKLPIEKQFPWGDYTVYIPAVYLFEEGLVLDICLEVNREKVAAFLEKWKDVLSGRPDERTFRKIRAENPLMHRFSQKLWVNGTQLRRSSGYGDSHIPLEMLPEDYQRQPEKPFVQGLGLDKAKVWTHFQMKYRWEENQPEKMDAMDILLSQDPYECFGEIIPMPEVGASVQLTHPKTGETYTLTATNTQPETIKLPPQPGVVFPDHVVIMSYKTEPELSRKEFYLADMEESDQPRKTDGAPGGHGGAFGMILRNPDQYAVSSAHFQPVETVTWQAVFLEKDLGDITVTLI